MEPNYANAPDRELVGARGADAFAAVYDRHAAAVYRWARSRVGDHADDLTAETFARAWLSRGSFSDRADGSALPWLLGIARRALALSLPATAAAAAAVLVTAGGAAGPSSANAAIIRHVRAELAGQPGLILHESATVTLPDGSTTPFELWAQTGGTGVYRVIKSGNEVSQSDTKNEIYDPARNTVTVSPLPPEIDQREMSRGRDLADQLRHMVDSGRATATPTTYNGIPAYELSLHASGDTFLNGTAYVARSDYRPLEITSTTNGGQSEKVVFSTYEYLPATQANDALLAVTTAHPGATVVNQPRASRPRARSPPGASSSGTHPAGADR